VSTHSLSLVLLPPPQLLVHELQSVHGVQSGQLSELHSLSSESSPAQRYARLSGSTHFRFRFCRPPPHVALHSVHSVHSVHTGQSWLLQVSSTSESPMQPPTFFGRTHSLTFFRLPPPQVLVHSVQSDHSPNSGHFCSLQVSCASSCSRQSLVATLLVFSEPGYTHSRLLNLVPQSQLAEHSVHSPHGVRTGHSCALQVSVILSAPGHWSTPRTSGSTHSRTLYRVPPPQVAVQSVHSVHSVQTGHLAELHSRFS